jgi:hypothetical protein
VAKFGILVLVLIAWLAIYLGRAVGVGIASFRRGYNEAQSVTRQIAAEELIVRSYITHKRKQTVAATQQLSSIATDLGLTVRDSIEPDHLVSTAAALLVKRAIKKVGWDLKDLDDKQEFVVLIVAFVACDYLSQIIGARFEICTVGAALKVFGRRRASVVGMLGEVGAEFNRLTADAQGSEIIIAVGNAFAKWVATRDDAEIDRVAGLMRIMTTAVS